MKYLVIVLSIFFSLCSFAESDERYPVFMDKMEHDMVKVELTYVEKRLFGQTRVNIKNRYMRPADINAVLKENGKSSPDRLSKLLAIEYGDGLEAYVEAQRKLSSTLPITKVFPPDDRAVVSTERESEKYVPLFPPKEPKYKTFFKKVHSVFKD